MRNVWIFNQYAVAPVTGGSTRHLDSAKRLPKRGWEATIFSGTSVKKARGDIGATHGRSFRLQEIDGVRFLWVQTIAYSANDSRRIWSMVLFALRAARLGRRKGPQVEDLSSPDVIVGSSVHPLAAAAALLAAKRHMVPFILELRDLWPQSLIEMGALSARHPFAVMLRWLEGWLVRRASRVIVLSERAADYLVDRGTPRAKIAYLPNGVDLDRFGEVAPPPASNEAFRLMYLGAHGIANRLHIILDAAAILQRRGVEDVRFIFVGGGSDQDNIRQQAEARALNHVEFQPGVAKQDVPATLASADALILTEANNVYGSSNKLSDYLAAGRPIVFSTYARHNIISGCGPAVDPEDAEALADAILSLRDLDRSARIEMGCDGRRYVEQHRSWDVLAERMADLLDKVADAGADL